MSYFNPEIAWVAGIWGDTSPNLGNINHLSGDTWVFAEMPTTTVTGPGIMAEIYIGLSNGNGKLLPEPAPGFTQHSYQRGPGAWPNGAMTVMLSYIHVPRGSYTAPQASPMRLTDGWDDSFQYGAAGILRYLLFFPGAKNVKSITALRSAHQTRSWTPAPIILDEPSRGRDGLFFVGAISLFTTYNASWEGYWPGFISGGLERWLGDLNGAGNLALPPPDGNGPWQSFLGQFYAFRIIDSGGEWAEMNTGRYQLIQGPIGDTDLNWPGLRPTQSPWLTGAPTSWLASALLFDYTIVGNTNQPEAAQDIKVQRTGRVKNYSTKDIKVASTLWGPWPDPTLTPPPPPPTPGVPKTFTQTSPGLAEVRAPSDQRWVSNTWTAPVGAIDIKSPESPAPRWAGDAYWRVQLPGEILFTASELQYWGGPPFTLTMPTLSATITTPSLEITYPDNFLVPPTLSASLQDPAIAAASQTYYGDASLLVSTTTEATGYIDRELLLAPFIGYLAPSLGLTWDVTSVDIPTQPPSVPGDPNNPPLPDPEEDPPPVAPDPPGTGGLILRAVPTFAVVMSTPTIVNGKPS